MSISFKNLTNFDSDSALKFKIKFQRLFLFISKNSTLNTLNLGEKLKVKLIKWKLTKELLY